MASRTADKAKGVVKEAVGKATGDKRTEAEGKTDQAGPWQGFAPNPHTSGWG